MPGHFPNAAVRHSIPGNHPRGNAMLTVAVMYPAAGSDTFDHGYYMASHIPMVRRLWEPMGLQNLQVLRGAMAPDGKTPTYTAIALLTFGDPDDFTAAAGRHGAEIFQDIPNFTDAKPVMQFNEAVPG